MNTFNTEILNNKNNTIRSCIYYCCDFIFFIFLCIDVQDELFNSTIDISLWMIYVFSMIIRIVIDASLRIKKPLFSLHFFWYGGLIIFGLMSLLWAIYIPYSIMILKVMIKSFAILFFIIYSINTNKDIEKYFKILISLSVFLVILLIIKTPMDAWGTDRIGYATGINSNKVSMLLSFSVLFCIYFLMKERKKIYLFLIPILVIISLLTGSKKGIIILFLGIFMIFFLSAKTSKKILYIFLAIFCSIIIFYLIMNVDIFYKTLGVRIDGFISSFTNNGVIDGSTSERLFFIEKAKQMFYQKPLIGHGLNSFMSYMMITNYSHIAYSHNNYMEMASCLGICGIAIYYSMYIYLLVNFKKTFMRENLLQSLMLVLLTLFILLEVAFVDYYEVIYQIFIALIFAYVRINKVEVIKRGYIFENQDEKNFRMFTKS